MEVNRDSLVDEFLQKINEKDLEIDQIRKILEKEHYSEDDIKQIIHRIDEKLQKQAVFKTSKKRSGQLIWIGLILMFIGVFITTGTYYGWINMGDYFMVMYGPFIAGVSVYVMGRIMQNRNSKIINKDQKYFKNNH